MMTLRKRESVRLDRSPLIV